MSDQPFTGSRGTAESSPADSIAARVQERRAAIKVCGLADKLASEAVLVQDAFDENVEVTIPISAWREFWDALGELGYGD